MSATLHGRVRPVRTKSVRLPGLRVVSSRARRRPGAFTDRPGRARDGDLEAVGNPGRKKKRCVSPCSRCSSGHLGWRPRVRATRSPSPDRERPRKQRSDATIASVSATRSRRVTGGTSRRPMHVRFGCLIAGFHRSSSAEHSAGNSKGPPVLGPRITSTPGKLASS